MRRKAQCVVRITSATLQLHKGRFQLDESLSTHCQGELRSRMLKRASGTVQLHGDRLTLDASNAALFWRASGRIHKHSLVLTEESENGHSRKVKWLFHERSAGKGQNSAHS